MTRAQRRIIIALINARHNQHNVERVVIKRDGSVHVWQRPKYGGQSRVNVFVGWASDLLADIKHSVRQFDGAAL